MSADIRMVKTNMKAIKTPHIGTIWPSYDAVVLAEISKHPLLSTGVSAGPQI